MWGCISRRSEIIDAKRVPQEHQKIYYACMRRNDASLCVAATDTGVSSGENILHLQMTQLSSNFNSWICVVFEKWSIQKNDQMV